MDVRFNLIKRTEGKEKSDFGIVSDQVKNPEFKVPDKLAQFFVGIDPIEEEEEDWSGDEDDDDDEEMSGDEETGGSGAEEDQRNVKRCQDLEALLANEFEPAKWAISLQMKMNAEKLITNRDDGWEDEWEEERVTSVDVLVEGEVLRKLHSLIMLYRLEKGHARLKMRIQGTLEAMDPNYYADIADWDEEDDDDDTSTVYKYKYTAFFESDLVPRMMDDGSLNHAMYAASNIKLKNRSGASEDTMVIPQNMNDRWGLSSLWLIVEGTVSDFDNDPALANMGMCGPYKKMLETAELDGDLKIVGEGGAVSLPCHSSVLRVQSDFINAKLLGGFEKDAEERTMKMMDRSKEEITALLEWFYYKGTEKPLRTPSVAMAMYELGDYLLVPEVKETMEGILLTRPAELFSVEAGLKLYALGENYGKEEFQRKAIDVLGIRTDDEIKGVEFFGQLFPSPKSRKEFLTSRKKFF